MLPYFPMNYVNIGYDSTNYYLIDCKRGRLLVDCGFPGTMPKLLAVLRRYKIDLAEIAYLFPTHFHPDHAGLFSELLASTAIKPLVIKEQLAFVREMESYFDRFAKYRPIQIDKIPAISTQQSRTFLHSIGVAGQILHTPGHSEDSYSLLTDDGTAFIGDLQAALGFNDNMDVAQRSWSLLRKNGAKKVCPGHGKPYKIAAIN